MKVCVCITEQLRGYIKCASTIKKYLVEHLDADVVACLQSIHKDREEENYIYNYVEKNRLVNFKLYENPVPDFSNVFNELANQFGYDKSEWRVNFGSIRSENWTNGFKSPGCCIRRMYNRYLLYDMLRDCDYDWYVILRPDLHFTSEFINIDNLDDRFVYSKNIENFRGYNNNLIIIPRSLLKSLIYIGNFLNVSLFNYIRDTLPNWCAPAAIPFNEELFFKVNMILSKIDINEIPLNMYYISADDELDYTSWSKIKKAKNGDLFKYQTEYNEAMKYLKEKNEIAL